MQPQFYEPNKLKQLIAIAANKAKFDTKDKSDSSEYRTLLKELTKKTSTSQMTRVELIKVLHHFQQAGFKITAAKAKKNNAPWLSKLISLWTELHERGFIRNKQYSALEQWAKGQFDSAQVDPPAKLEWMSKYNNELIEKLKKFGHRCLCSAIHQQWPAFQALLKANMHKFNEEERDTIESVFSNVNKSKLSYQEALDTFDFMQRLTKDFGGVSS
jgi:phage gp16-like protein